MQAGRQQGRLDSSIVLTSPLLKACPRLRELATGCSFTQPILRICAQGKENAASEYLGFDLVGLKWYCLSVSQCGQVALGRCASRRSVSFYVNQHISIYPPPPEMDERCIVERKRETHNNENRLSVTPLSLSLP